jgi:DNA-binding CsgD family transcriptional regulator
VDTTVVDGVVRRSEGVPFFVEELTSPGIEQGSAGLPESLREILLTRASRLSAHAWRLTRAAALAGHDIRADQLRVVTGLDAGTFDAVLRDVVESQILLRDPERPVYQFRHALLAEAVAQDMLCGERVRLHRAWASALGGDRVSPGAAIAAAHHWYQAGDVAQAFDAALCAAEEARGLSAPGEELLLLERVLALWPQLPDPCGAAGCDRAEVAERAADAAWRAGHERRADALLAEALDEVPRGEQPTRHAHLLVRRARVFEEQADPAVGEWLREALALADRPDWPDRGQALLGLAIHHSVREDAAESVRLGSMALQVARTTHDRAAQAMALAEIGPMLARCGRLEECLDALDEAHHTALSIGDATALVVVAAQRSGVLLLAGHFTAAAEVARAGREVARHDVVARRYTAQLVCNEVEARIAAGQWSVALELARRMRGTNPPRVFAAALDILIARILVARGSPDADRAVQVVREAPPEVLQEPQVGLPRAETLGRWELAQRRPCEAVTVLGNALRRHVEHGEATIAEWSVTHSLVEAVQQLDDAYDRTVADAALGLVADVRALGRATPPWDHVISAELDGDEKAWAAATAVLTGPAVEGPVYLRAYAQYRWAEALVGQGRRQDAAAPLWEAARTLQQLGATPLLTHVVGLARREHLPLPPGVGRPTPTHRPFGLTGRELEVLGLLAAGRSNASIAQQLVISAKTAAVHVSHILTKMGVSSRTEAATVALRQGLVGNDALPGR